MASVGALRPVGLRRRLSLALERTMSFNSEARIVRDENAPVGLRYISLRHCVQMFCPLGFGNTWSFLASKVGLKENEPNAHSAFVDAIDVLSEWRRLHIQRESAKRQYIQGLVKLGLPKSIASE